MRRNSTARAIALVSVGLVVAAGLGVGVASTASASSVVSTPGVTTATVGNYPNSESVSPDNKWLYVGSSYEGKIWAIDVHTKKVVGSMAAPGVGDIAFSRTGRHAYALAGGSILVIDTTTRKVTAKVADPSNSDSVRLESGGRYLLLTSVNRPGAATFDTLTDKVAVLPVTSSDTGEQHSATGATAYGLDYDSATSTTTFVRSSTATGAVLARSAPWSGQIYQGEFAASSNGSVAAVLEPLASGSANDSDRIVDIIDPHSAAVVRTVTIPWTGSFWSMAVSPDGSAVIVRLGGTLTIVDSETGQIRGGVPLAAPDSYWSYSPDGGTMYVTEQAATSRGGAVDAIRLSDARVLQHVQVGTDPEFALPSVTGNTLYVPNYRPNTVSLVSMTLGLFRPAVRQDWGSDRYGSSVVDSRIANDSATQETYVTSDVDPALMLGVAAVAGAGPLNQFLVIPKTGASSAAIAEITRAKAFTIYVVGNENIVSASAFAALRKVFGDTVVRVAGADSTATLVAAEKTDGASTATSKKIVYVADSRSSAAALMAPNEAARDEAAYVLVDGASTTLPDSVRTYLTDADAFPDPLTFKVMGSESTISSGIAEQLATLGTVQRFDGADRYAIAESVSGVSDSSPSAVMAVNSADVVGAAMSVSVSKTLRASVSLVHPTCVPAAVAAQWRRQPAVEVALLGSPSQLGAGVAAGTACP